MPTPTYTKVPSTGTEAVIPGYATYGICAIDGTAFTGSSDVWTCTNGHAYEVFVRGELEAVVYHAIGDGIASTSLAIRNVTVNASRGAVTAGTDKRSAARTVQATVGYVAVVS